MNSESKQRGIELSGNEASFYLGSIPVKGKLTLAPMAGFSDPPFRSLCRRFGSNMSYTVFINAMDILYKWENTRSCLHFLPDERPVVFQLFDNDRDRILQAAFRVRELNPDALDINMGCSTRRVSSRGAGAGLLRDPAAIGQIIRDLSQSIDIPVSAKIRLGWNESSRNYLEVSRIIEENGGALIAVHARTREQAYQGQADWDAIARIKQNVSIPVIGNGDVRCVHDIHRMQALTGCDGVMIGRGAVGNPWIFQYRDRADISRAEAAGIISEHLYAELQYYGKIRGVELFRKHLIRYLEPEQMSRIQRNFILTRSTPQEVINALKDLGYPVVL